MKLVLSYAHQVYFNLKAASSDVNKELSIRGSKMQYSFREGHSSLLLASPNLGTVC